MGLHRRHDIRPETGQSSLGQFQQFFTGLIDELTFDVAKHCPLDGEHGLQFDDHRRVVVDCIEPKLIFDRLGHSDIRVPVIPQLPPRACQPDTGINAGRCRGDLHRRHRRWCFLAESCEQLG